MKNNQISNNQIYLDASSTSPTRFEVISYMHDIESNFWGNPSSIHFHGIRAAEIVERSRLKIATILQALTDEIVFTSGSTESIHLAILGSTKDLMPGRIVISNVEHPSVLSAALQLVNKGWELKFWPVNNYGVIDIDLINDLLKPPTKIVSLIWGQSEIGTIQPIPMIGKECKDRGIIFHTDATQILSQGLFNWRDLNVDLLSLSAHKFQGPKGIGLLLARKEIKKSLSNIQGGGGQESNIRSGTQPITLIAGMSLAIELLNSPIYKEDVLNQTEFEKVSSITRYLRHELEKIQYLRFTGHPTKRLNNHISMLVGNAENNPLPGRLLVRELSKRGISASSGTACSSGNLTDSPILKAINVSTIWRQSGLRFSLGPWIKCDEIERIPTILRNAIDSLSNPKI